MKKKIAMVGATALLLMTGTVTAASAATTVNVCGNSFNGGPAGNQTCTNGQVKGNTGTVPASALPAWILKLLGY
ncbi:hypothetical protein AB0D08_11445 [Kitasatospora sp. NPDC048540]|uniref:hypothetical protein n=1 Tax=unclassified Kitasatospora TaxID=2633591 RepID=UPI00053B4B33|nr:hypothetical protein [Kitasatospora sp. MBT63]